MLAKFIVKRLLHLIPLLLIISVLVYSLLLLIPGDPTFAILGQDATEQQRIQLRAELGLDRPIYVRYWFWLTDALQGDLGRSFMSKEKVLDIVLRNMGATLQLVSLAIVLAVVFGIGLGVLSVLARKTNWDTVFRIASYIGVAVPSYVIAIVLVLVLSVQTGLLPATGFTSVLDDPLAFLRSAIMPAIALAAVGVAIISRQMRSALTETLNQDYMNTALSKGLSYRATVLQHGFQNALLPVVTTVGVMLSDMIGGTIILESVFAIPGIGRVIINSILQRDIVVLQGAILLLVLLVVVVNFIVDIAYSVIDPRISL